MLLHRRLDTLLKTLSPSRRVVLAMDGPAPLAKLLEQRRRRRRESERSQYAEKAENEAAAEDEANGKGSSGVKTGSGISPLFLTTGTLFMLEVHNSLVYYICERLSGPQFRHLHFELSDSTVKGEGELKILSRLLHSAASDVAPEETHVIVGGDSDLIVMSIASGQRHVALWDDVANRKYAKSPVFFRDKLEAIWRRDHLGPYATQTDIANLGLDLALLAIISSGNDYLPGCQGFALQNKGRPGLWSLYLDMRRQPEWKGRSLIKRSCSGCDETSTGDSSETPDNGCTGDVAVNIDRPVLAALLRRYNEQRHLLAAEAGNARSSPTKFQSYGSNKGAWNFAFPAGGAGGEGQSGPPPSLQPLPPLSHPWRQPADPEKYIEGLEWVLTMYATGSVTDYRFSYPGAPPTVPVFLDTLDGNVTTSEESTDSEELKTSAASSSDTVSKETEVKPASRSKKKTDLQPLIPAACALALLPARSRRQAATALRHLMDADSPVAEIYAICTECQELGAEVRSVGQQLDEVRQKLSELQGKLGTAGLDADGAHDAEGDLTAASETFEAAQEKLKSLLGDLSRSQQEHFKNKHPFKPFPTKALEAAVTAVPLENYHPRERRLARFGREMVFKSGDYAALSSDQVPELIAAISLETEVVTIPPGGGGVVINGSMDETDDPLTTGVGDAGWNALPGWLRDASRFAASYPRLANQDVVQGAASGVIREVLPLHPYMQPRSTKGKQWKGRGAPPTALYMACQMRRYSGGTNNLGLGYSSTMTREMWSKPAALGSGLGAPSRKLMGLAAAATRCYSAALPMAVPSMRQNRLVQVALKTVGRVLPHLRAL